MREFAKILLPTDFSATAQIAVDFVREHVSFRDSEIVVVHAFELPFLPVHHAIQLATREAVESEAREASASRLAETVASLKNGDDRVLRSVHREGVAHEVLLAVAAEEAPDLIVMSSHGYRGIQKFVLGSTTDRVLRQAQCPVLTIR